ncbi:efflux RND transporter periplasmic adaptor subunit [Paenibacillus sp. SYP-B3998]|uniref:Efflux RND transporter periplasmic adaptor subunit n=2 Tax=Paenibacillus sp. SYP-B3998 TaxID=2678564 RepID=A0A6G3ZRR8_9BACL|nr:efflux RND transporter periplasmic adaptor subunit [Paenibacillus sp. SYP-B3998]
MSKMNNKKSLSIMMLTLLLVASGCGVKQTEEKSASSSLSAAKVVSVGTVQKVKWDEHTELAADVIPFLELDVVVKANGDVVNVNKRRGDTVSKDETIMEIDKTDILREKEKVDAALLSATEQYDKAKKDLADSKKEIELSIAKTDLSVSDLERDYAKLRNDYDQGLAEKNQIKLMETKLNQVRLDLELLHSKKNTLETSNPLSQAEYQLKSARISQENWQRSLSYYDVKAPISGILTYMPAEEGMTLQSGMQIAKVQQQNLVKLKANLTESYWLLAQGKNELGFTNPSTGESFTGKVIYVSSTADLQTKTFELQLQADNSQGKLKPGTRVMLQFNESLPNESLTIPADAIVSDNGQTFVFIVKGEKVEKRVVKTGKLKDNKQEITSGLDGSEKLVTHGQLRLQDGEQVSIAQP